MNGRIASAVAAGLRFMGKGVLHEWQHRLRALFAAIILLQFVIWFDEYWLNATTWLVTAAIAVAFAVGCFPRAPFLLRLALGLLLISCTHFVRLGIRFDFTGLEQLAGYARIRAIAAAVGDGLVQMSPYVWFAFGAWAIYSISLMLLNERTRIIAYVAACVFIFAVVDSYSLYVFWDQVALIVFSGLGLIILEHFEHFRRKHPESWSYFTEYPLTITASVVIIVALVMTAGIAAPNAPPMLTDPYTAYMNWKGKAVVTGGKGFPESRSSVSLNASSGYGRDDSNLGGGFDYDYSEVMRVETSQRTYYRGETKSLYTGSGWLASESDRNVSVTQVAVQEPLPPFEWGMSADMEVQTVRLEQAFYMSGDRTYPVLFGAHPIRTLGAVSVEEGETVSSGVLGGAGWSPRQGELRWNEERPYPGFYSVVSEVPVIGPSLFDGTADYDFSGERWAPYLQLPDALPERVRNLARDIAAEGANPYEKVKRIEQYLQANFEYDNRPDLSEGGSPDFVDRFLFEIQSGYCDYFSTAMAVMVRSIGIPARWVKGYASGSLEIDEMSGLPMELIEQMEAGTYIVRNADAHSWVEVYFPETGWVPFEPTSGFVLPQFVPEEQQFAAETMPTDALEVPQDAEADNGTNRPAVWAVIAVIVAAVAAAVPVGIKYRRRNSPARFRSQRSGLNANQRALIEVNRIIRMCRRKGYRRDEYETAREAFTRWSGTNRRLQHDLDIVLDVLEKAKYSNRGITAEDVSRLAQAKRRMKEAL